MKHIPVKKINNKRFIVEVIKFLPKPKIPLNVFWNVHKVENFYFDSNFSNSNH